MTGAPTRRRFLAISAAACALGAGARSWASPVAETRWRGTALGAAASIRITGLAPEAARPIVMAVERELSRLEGIFSLYRPGSALLRLNTNGHLEAPPPELLEVLSLSGALHRATAGAFDPTVQPLFAAHARAGAENRRPTRQEIAAAKGLVGWDGVHLDTDAVRLSRAGAALTLNGIAQGYVTDRIADLLRGRGLDDVLVDAGEIVALGHRPDGIPWSAGVAAPGGALVHRLTLTDRALATSATKGTLLDPARELGHIFDAARGSMAAGASVIAVSDPRAALADGLSTALCVLSAAQRDKALGAFPDARLEFVV